VGVREGGGCEGGSMGVREGVWVGVRGEVGVSGRVECECAFSTP